ncbi:hypothetical protein SAMN05660742_10660 [Propionispira arboris]|uniref:Uncharacterized protein n=1 Tax=Propionispira arboris TaxID=84035 RepID=A0A1H6YDT6_9FIRM|nr:hypothetical protein SAMN05660742_10660 [Propionispira arboris]
MGEKLNTEKIVGIGLVAALIAAIFLGMNELAMSIASGLVGYMGGKAEKRGGDINDNHSN